METLGVKDLYGAYGPAIFARCKRLLKDGAAAEDATQEVFLKVIRHAGSMPRERGAVLPWIHRIATNHCLNVLRDSQRQASPVDTIPDEPDEGFEDTVVQRDFAEQVLAKAPEAIRVPAVLYHGQGLEQAKVAAALGISRRTVLYRLAEFSRRAMQLHALAEGGLM